jgi:hypothetical protein
MKASPKMLAASAFMYVLFYAGRAYRWKIILRPLKNPVKFSNTFWITAIGYLVNMLIPVRIGELTRAFLIDRSEKIGFSGGLSSIAIERLLDLIAVATIGALTIFFASFTLNVPKELIGSLQAIAILILIIVALLFLAVRFEEKICLLLSSILRRLPGSQLWKEKILGFIKALIESVRIMISKPALMSVSMVLSWMLWIANFLAFYFLFKAFNYETSVLIILLGFIFMMITFILPAAPGYVGSFEAFWMLVFMGLGLTQMNILLAMGLTMHLLTIGITITLGIIGIAVMGISLGEALKVRGRE